MVMVTNIPEPFKRRYGQLVDDKKAFYKSLGERIPLAFRVNTIKAERKDVVNRFGEYGIEIKQAAFYPDAFTTDDLRVGKTIEHFAGHIYMQEIVSMLPPLVMELPKGGTILDAAAAPGSKTTQISALLNNQGTVIANDISYARIKALVFNMEKLGVMNAIVLNKDVRYINGSYDSILLDAPCSAEGTIHKNWKVLPLWSEERIRILSNIQKQMIIKCFDLLKSGGSLVYATCTFAPEENEEVIQYLLDKREARLEKIRINGLGTSPALEKWGDKKFGPEIQKAVRIWPHHNNTGGFFIAKIWKD